MDALLACTSVSVSELRDSPARVFEQAGDEALMVLNHNKPAGYIVSNAWMERVVGLLADHVVTTRAVTRLSTVDQAFPISPDHLVSTPDDDHPRGS